MLLLPPVHSILILVSTILKTYNGSVLDEYNSKINVIKQPFSKFSCHKKTDYGDYRRVAYGKMYYVATWGFNIRKKFIHTSAKFIIDGYF